MKAFIEKIFKLKKQKQKEILDEIIHTEVIQKNKEILSEQIETSVKNHIAQNQVTEAVVESIIKEVKEEVVKFKKPGHYFPDCNCFKCVRWRNQNA